MGVDAEEVLDLLAGRAVDLGIRVQGLAGEGALLRRVVVRHCAVAGGEGRHGLYCGVVGVWCGRVTSRDEAGFGVLRHGMG